jgi:DNA ligase-1
LQQRLGRRQPDLWLPLEVPVSFIAFDLLHHDQEMLLALPLSERRRRLEQMLVGATSPAIQFFPPRLCTSADEVERAFDQALARGNEGVMAKAPDSPYTPGRRGRSWIKLKRPMATLDVVVTAVEYGHGKRAGWLSDYTFSVRDGDRLLTIGKAYSGLTDAEILEFTEYFKQHTLEDHGFRRQVEPTVVLEVAFNNIQRSTRHQSGYALRFPRIVRLRPDKPLAEIDTLGRVKELYERQLGSRAPGR